MLTVHAVDHEDEVARRLWAEQWAELGQRYGGLSSPSDIPPDGLISSLVGWVGDTPVGTVAVRFAAPDGIAPVAEIKRLYVAPDWRGRGFSKVLMGAAEKASRRAGATRIILETGTEQPEAVALYTAIGYDAIPSYGSHRDDPRSLAFAKDLPSRILVISGTIGAGKTEIGGAVSDLLAERGVRHGFIDGDYLAQAEPPLEGDPHNQALMFAALAAIAPAYRERGYGSIVFPRVVEDEADRGRYARAFVGPGGVAQVSIIRLAASEETRLARVAAREPEGKWRAWGSARTVELEVILAASLVEDAIVQNDGRDRLDVAAEVLDAAGW